MTNKELLKSVLENIKSEFDDNDIDIESFLETLNVALVTIPMDHLLSWIRSTCYEVANNVLERKQVSTQPLIGGSTPGGKPVDFYDKDDTDIVVEMVARTYIYSVYFNVQTENGFELNDFRQYVRNYSGNK